MSDPVRDYLNHIGRVPLLTAAEEIELGHAIQKMLALKRTGRTDFSHKERSVIRRGERARERMITANLRLVVSVAKKYNKYCNSLELLDLIQEGNIGLNRAVELFDPERGYKFSTYSFWWIRQGIVRATLTTNNLIRLPSAATEAIRKLRYWRPDFESKHGRLPTLQECADFCKVSVPTIRQYLHHPTDCLSLDRKVENDEDRGSFLIDLIPDESYAPDASDSTEVDRLLNAIDSLSDLQKTIVTKYFGLDGEDDMTFQKIGEELGLARQSVQQHKDRAFRQIRLRMATRPGKFPAQRKPSSLNWSSTQAA